MALEIVTMTLPDGMVNVSYSGALEAVGGIGDLIWSATGLPPDLACDQVGNVTGIPQANGQYTFTAKADDSEGHSCTESISLRIKTPGGP